MLQIAILLSSTACFQAGDEDVAALISLLQARDRAMRTTRVAFRVEQRAPREQNALVASWEGSWHRDGVREALLWDETIRGHGAVRRHTVWDGSQRREYWDGGETGPRGMTISPSKGGVFAVWLPRNFGLEFLIPWPEQLRSGRTMLVGREAVAGRDCAKLRWTMPATRPGGPPSVMHLWIDDRETLLVWRSVMSVPLERADSQTVPDRPSASTDVIDGIPYVASLETTLENAFRCGTIWLPLEGTQCTPENRDAMRIHLRVDPEGTRINAPADAGIFEVTPRTETIVFDEARRESFVVLPGRGMVSDTEVALEKAIAAVAREDGVRAADPPAVPQPVLTASCGPKALYLWLRLAGARVTLDEILRQVPASEETSLQELASASACFGRPLEPVRIDPLRLRDVGGSFIAHLKEAGTKAEHRGMTHYALARVVGSEVRLVSIPGGVVRVPLETFLTVFTGYALVTPESMAALERSHPLWSFVLPAIAVGLAAIALVLFLRRRGAPVAAALVVVLLSIPVGCRREKPAPDARTAAAGPLRAVGSSTHDFGSVREGDVVRLSFPFRNASDGSVRLATAGSCGCTDLALTRTTLAAGEEASVNVVVHTVARGGGMNEFVEILADGRRALTFWVVGQVAPGVRLTATPHEHDLGIIAPGETVEREIVVEAITTGFPVPVRLECAAVPSATALCRLEGLDAPVECREAGRDNQAQVFRVSLRVEGVTPGELRAMTLPIIARDRDGAARAVVNVTLRGRVTSGLYAEPDALFAGTLSATDSVAQEIVLRRPSDAPDAPEMASSCSWITARVDPADASRVHVRIGPGVPAGPFRERLEVRWGDAPALSVPIVGLGRVVKP